jgi:hypothetical protein
MAFSTRETYCGFSRIATGSAGRSTPKEDRSLGKGSKKENFGKKTYTEAYYG